MSESNPYRAPITSSTPSESHVSAQASLTLGFLVDGAGVVLSVIGMSQWPWLRAFLPFAAGHAVAAALIVFRASRSGQRLTSGDHFFLRYGALMMAAATALLRAVW